MSPPEERLREDRNLWLATVRGDGRPHLVPLWFTWTGGSFWVGTGEGSVKVANLRAEPRATLALEDGDRPVVAEVVGRVAARPYPDDVVAAFRAKYGWDLTQEEDADVGRVALLELAPLRWVLGGPGA